MVVSFNCFPTESTETPLEHKVLVYGTTERLMQDAMNCFLLLGILEPGDPPRRLSLARAQRSAREPHSPWRNPSVRGGAFARRLPQLLFPSGACARRF